MATTSGGKILLAYRGNCIGGSPCVAECNEPTCSDLQGIGLDEVIHPEASHGKQYKLPGFASAIAFDQDDFPVLTYLEKLKKDEQSSEVIVWKVRFYLPFHPSLGSIHFLGLDLIHIVAGCHVQSQSM